MHICSIHLINSEFSERVTELRLKARDILKQIMFCRCWPEPVEKRNKLIEERDSIIELFVLLCTRFCVPFYI